MGKTKLYTFVLSACGAGYVWVVLHLLHVGELPAACLFRRVTHIPCPSCGSTHSVLALLNGDLYNTFYYNPLGFLIALLMIILPVWILSDLVTGKERFMRAYQSLESVLKRKQVAIPVILLILSNWIWNIYKYL
ncbi:MAG: DUF2752 domain-containing protein [Tannerellaceae bacterium]|jgi:hypothetical protein|nr:DUF2752 domain-containing protein [Tannerellaceae bacterium]